MKVRSRLSWLLPRVLVIGSATGSFGQGTTGQIAGRVLDSQGLAVPGATVTVAGPQGAQVVVSDAAGRFTVPFLVPGSGYEVRVELQGFKTVERGDIDVRLGQTVDLTLTLEVGGRTDTVQVTATSPVIDLSTTTTGATLDNAFLEGIPTGRRFTDTLFIAPGVSSGGGTGEANPSFSGGSGLENLYLVDGLNITNTGFGAVGSYSIIFGSLGTGLPFDFMEEVQVKTGGYEPEFGESTGGITNVITKSGTNALRGSTFGFWQPTDLQEDFRQIETVNGAVNTTQFEDYDIGGTIGGPVLKDKVFFFGAVDPSHEEQTLTAPDDVESFPARALGEVDRERDVFNYAAKGTVQINSHHRVDASFFGDPGNGDPGPQRDNALLGANDGPMGPGTARFSELNEFGGHNQSVRWNGIMTPKWFLEASFSRAQNDFRETPLLDEPSFTDRTVSPNRVLGGVGFFENLDGENLQFQVKSTHLFNAGGAHELKGGLLFDDIDFDRTLDRTGQPITLADGTVTATGAQGEIIRDANVGEIVRVTRANLISTTQSTQEYLTLFVQDTWRPHDRVTITGGLRWDRQRLECEAQGFTWDENFAPRVGGTVDPLGDGTIKLFANCGRFYGKIPNDLAIRTFSLDPAVTRADFFDRALTRPVPVGTTLNLVSADGTVGAPEASVINIPGSEVTPIDPDINGSSQDEVVVGAEYELMPGLNVGGRYIRRRLNDVVEDIGTFPLLAFLDPASAAGNVEFFLTNPGPDTPVNQFRDFSITHADPTRDYDAVEIFADKRFGDNWRLQSDVSLMTQAGAPDDSPWRALPDGSSEWAVLAIGGRTNLGGVYGLARSEAATRLALWALQWSRVLTAAHGPKPLRGQLQMGFELVPFLRAVQNRQTLGFGVSPVFLRWRLLGTRRFQPYLEGLAGIARTDQQLPEGTTRFNFTSQAGLGARVAVSDNLGLLVGYRFHHLSNGGRRPQNPGLNFHVVYVGLSWIRPHDGL